MLGSLLAACEAVPSLARWSVECQRDPDVASLLKEDDRDASAKIVAAWMKSVHRVFLERGRRLVSKAA